MQKLDINFGTNGLFFPYKNRQLQDIEDKTYKMTINLFVWDTYN